MHPILFSFGPFRVFSYGFMIAAGLAAAFFIIKRRGVVYGIDPDRLIDLIIAVTTVGIICARVLYVIRFSALYREDWLGIFRIWEGGLIFYGGAIGATVFLIGYAFFTKRSFAVLADAIVPYLALVHGFGRIGCFLNGCCGGAETSCFLGVVFPGTAQAVYPTQLYEAFFCFLLAGFLFLLLRRQLKPGALVTIYFLAYAIERFFIEFIRTNQRVFWGLSHAQIISVGIFVVAMIIFIARRFWEPHRGERA